MGQDAVRARYAEYAGHRIPCESGRAKYHLTPERAESCCWGITARLRREFDALSPVIDLLPMRRMEADDA